MSDDAREELARLLRQCRLDRGMSLRVLARRMGMSAHSGLADYEWGRRIPPEDLIAAYARVFDLPAGALHDLRARAFAERARRADPPPRAAGGRPPRWPSARATSLAALAIAFAVAEIVRGISSSRRRTDGAAGREQAV